jgi:hypothetical protein
MKEKHLFQRSSATMTSQATLTSTIVAHQTDLSSKVYLHLIKFLLLDRSINRKICHIAPTTSLAENAVGISLVLIGLLGVKESLESDHYHPDASLNEIQEKKSMRNRAIFANGVLHGFSWDGAPSIAPALAISTWQAAVYFLLAYSLGTVLAMSISASAIGALSSKISKLGNFSKSPDFPKKISLYSSMLATVIGIYWIALTIFK